MEISGSNQAAQVVGCDINHNSLITAKGKNVRAEPNCPYQDVQLDMFILAEI